MGTHGLILEVQRKSEIINYRTSRVQQNFIDSKTGLYFISLRPYTVHTQIVFKIQLFSRALPSRSQSQYTKLVTNVFHKADINILQIW